MNVTDYSHDAWKQYIDIVDKFTSKHVVRSDLHVYGLAHERVVRFCLRYKDLGDYRMGLWHETTRNVKTMRELAQALLDACDFVDAQNPGWASSHNHPVRFDQ